MNNSIKFGFIIFLGIFIVFLCNSVFAQDPACGTPCSRIPTNTCANNATCKVCAEGTNVCVASQPVTVIHYQVSLNLRTIQVLWTTLAEENSKSFIIEMAGTNGVFRPIGELPAAGFSRTLKHYSFEYEIKNPESLTYYVRVREQDHDGAEQMFAPKTVQLQLKNALDGLTFYPNPASEIGNIRFLSGQDQKVDLVIQGYDGRQVYTDQVNAVPGSNSIPLEVDQIPSGIYVVRISAGDSRLIQRFVRQ